ncbi:hypothetical protein [Natrinema zhouii]|nr:hypothetical protein [Natrinema zhouii]
MSAKSAIRDSLITLSPVVGFGLTVAITLTAAVIVGFLAVVLVG